MRQFLASLALSLCCFFGAIGVTVSETSKQEDEKVCTNKVLHLGGQTKWIRWWWPGFSSSTAVRKFTGIVVFRDGTNAFIQGDWQGFCDIDKSKQLNEGNYLTAEESAMVEEIFSFYLLQADDSMPASKPGDVDDLPTISRLLTHRTSVYDNYPLGRNYNLKRFSVAMNPSGALRSVNLPPDRVFMSRHALRFLQGHHKNGMAQFAYLVIEAQLHKGPAVAVYGYHDRRLRLLARTPWHGHKEGWISVIHASDFDRDGCTEIAIIRDPQGAGVLEIWEFRPEASPDGTPYTLVREASAPGFSNHIYGTYSDKLSLIMEVDGDGLLELIVPDATRSALRVMKLTGGEFREIHSIALPSPIAHRMTYNWGWRGKPGNNLVVPLEDGTVRFIPVDIESKPRVRPKQRCGDTPDAG